MSDKPRGMGCGCLRLVKHDLFKLALLAALFLTLKIPSARAEPWLSARFAQNCASCHAPGRKNLAAPDRRCSLSCQGCHVNPNGGGLRSLYGKWNEDRWLRSFRADALANAKAPAPTAKQEYAEPRKVKARTPGRGVARARAAAALPKDGYKLVETEAVAPNENAYLRDGREFETVNRDEWAEQVPQADPYRLMGVTKVEAGADIRWQVAQSKFDDGDPDTEDPTLWRSFFMMADFGVRLRPLYRHLSLVYEARMLGLPNSRYEERLLSSNTRSLYVMVDDLPFNTFVMAGYYRPLFGNFVPDHYTLAQEMTATAMTGSGQNYNELFNAISLGTAPNVPYANVHLIQKQAGDPDDNTKGFATNLGLRFVTLGASINYSYWRTNNKPESGAKAETATGVEMHSIGLAGHYKRLTASLDAVSLARDEDDTSFRQGGVITLDTYTQIWRENYFTFNYAKANTNRQLMPGAATQIKTGFRSFLYSGVDLSFYYEILNEKSTQEATLEQKKSGYSAQLHLFM